MQVRVGCAAPEQRLLEGLRLHQPVARVARDHRTVHRAGEHDTGRLRHAGAHEDALVRRRQQALVPELGEEPPAKDRRRCPVCDRLAGRIEGCSSREPSQLATAQRWDLHCTALPPLEEAPAGLIVADAGEEGDAELLSPDAREVAGGVRARAAWQERDALALGVFSPAWQRCHAGDLHIDEGVA